MAEQGKLEFRVELNFGDLGRSGRMWFIDVPVEELHYESREDAVGAVGGFSGALSRDSETKETLLAISLRGKIISQIRWNEWWRYTLYATREGEEVPAVMDPERDCVPAAESFDALLEEFGGEQTDRFSLECQAYCISAVPIEVDGNVDQEEEPFPLEVIGYDSITDMHLLRDRETGVEYFETHSGITPRIR